MSEKKRDCKSIYADSSEISNQLRTKAETVWGGYSLMEAATHIDCMYRDMCRLQDEVEAMSEER
jgi:hypothetical protein